MNIQRLEVHAQMPSYPPSEWAKLSAGDKSFMIEAKKLFNCVYTGKVAPPGIIPFQIQDRKGKRYIEK